MPSRAPGTAGSLVFVSFTHLRFTQHMNPSIHHVLHFSGARFRFAFGKKNKL